MSAAAQLRPLHVARHAIELEETVRTELRLLAQLNQELIAQRQAITREHADEVNDSVHAVARVLRTLEEARRKRQYLCHLLLGAVDVSPAALPGELGQTGDAPFARAVDELLSMAAIVARSIAVNRRLLQGAARTGRDLVRLLQGEPPGELRYERTGAPVEHRRGTILNRNA